MSGYYQEEFTPEETSVLNRFVTNTELPVFGLINLPEVVKGALFARYSRSAKSLRRLLLDEFINDEDTGIETLALKIDDDPMVAMRRAEDLYKRIFFEYGDDSVAQLGGAHLFLKDVDRRAKLITLARQLIDPSPKLVDIGNGWNGRMVRRNRDGRHAVEGRGIPRSSRVEARGSRLEVQRFEVGLPSPCPMPDAHATRPMPYRDAPPACRVNLCGTAHDARDRRRAGDSTAGTT
jgi:hypothetical protein